MSMSTSPFRRFSIDDEQDPLVVPDMSQDEVFALIDDFYGDSSPRPAASSPELGEDGLDSLMDDLEDVEKFAQQLDGDILMHDVAPPLESAHSVDREPAIRTASSPAARSEMLEDQLEQTLHNASPSLHVARVSDSEAPGTLPSLADERDIPEVEQPHMPSLADSPMEDASPLYCSAKPLIKGTIATSSQLILEPTVMSHEYAETPAIPFTSHGRESAPGSSAAPSTGGHRSSMHGEMRKEEEELASGDLGDLPPFPGFRVYGDISSRVSIASLLGKDDRKGSYDLSGSPDIDGQQIATATQPVPKQQVTSRILSFESTTMGNAADSPLGIAAAKNLKRVRRASSPVFTPAKKARQPSSAPSLESSQISAKESNEAIKVNPTQDIDSSLTDISLSALSATTPEQAVEQSAAPTSLPLHGNNEKPKDSFATSLREFKAEDLSSPGKDEAVTASTTAKPKSTPKRKRASKPAAKAQPVPGKGAPATEMDSSPAPGKASKVPKMTGKAKKSAPATNDLKGIIQAGVLSDVLRTKGPRQTRGSQKKIADTKPDAALAAKSRHTTTVNYKE